METAFRVSVAAYGVVWLYAALALPDRVPIHFGVSGAVDAVADKTSALMIFAAIGAGTALVLWWAARLVLRGSIHLLNLPHKPWWTQSPEREQRARRMLRHDALIMATATMALLVVVLASTVGAAQSDQPRLGGMFFVALAAYLVGTAVWTVRMYRGRYHPDRQEGTP